MSGCEWLIKRSENVDEWLFSIWVAVLSEYRLSVRHADDCLFDVLWCEWFCWIRNASWMWLKLSDWLCLTDRQSMLCWQFNEAVSDTLICMWREIRLLWLAGIEIVDGPCMSECSACGRVQCRTNAADWNFIPQIGLIWWMSRMHDDWRLCGERAVGMFFVVISLAFVHCYCSCDRASPREEKDRNIQRRLITQTRSLVCLNERIQWLCNGVVQTRNK